MLNLQEGDEYQFLPRGGSLSEEWQVVGHKVHADEFKVFAVEGPDGDAYVVLRPVEPSC